MANRYRQEFWQKFAFLTLAIASPHCQASAQNSKKLSPVNQDLLNQYLYPLLRNPLFIELNWNQPVLGQTDKYMQMPNEKAEHPEGIFRAYNIAISVYSTEPLQVGLYSESEVRVLAGQPANGFDEYNCKRNATQFLQTAFPWFFAMGPTPDPTVAGPNEKGNWLLDWQRDDKAGLPDVMLHAEVRAIDGKVVAFAASKFVDPWLHKITPDQAKSRALRAAIAASKVNHISIRHWKVTGANGHRYYAIQLEGQELGTLHALQTSILIDAMSGEPNAWAWDFKDAKQHGPRPIFTDRLPVWTKQGLIFLSDRPAKGVPAWATYAPQVLLQGSNKRPEYLTADLAAMPGFLSGLPNSSWVAIDRSGWTYALDLESGNYKVLAYPQRGGAFPAIDATGHWAVTCRQGHDANAGTQDLFVDNLQRSSKLPDERVRLVAEDEQNHPTFSPDGQWLYFVTTRYNSSARTSSLERIPIAVVQTSKPLMLKDQNAAPSNPMQLEVKQAATIVAELPEGVDRLSIFPDGEHLLVQGAKGMYIVGVLSQKVSKLAFVNLIDADLDNVYVQETKDGWAGPTNSRITFAGKTTDHAGKTRWRIYSCDLDGTRLKALTPKVNTALEAYHFSHSKRTGTDLAKEWALSEIQSGEPLLAAD